MKKKLATYTEIHENEICLINSEKIGDSSYESTHLEEDFEASNPLITEASNTCKEEAFHSCNLDSNQHDDPKYLPNISSKYHDFKVPHLGKYARKTRPQLQAYSRKDLQNVLNDLSATIKALSEQLVSLLKENDRLQHEVDARNIAIEQLLKITVSETEQRPIQMSLVLPSEE